jgi:uncharacterized repeat protein (TIGR04138 family)
MRLAALFHLGRNGNWGDHYRALCFRLQRVWMRSIARAIDSTRSAVEFVLDSFGVAVQLFGNRFTARQLCEALVELARRVIGNVDEAREMLLHWKIRSSEDVGRIAITLLQAGVAHADSIAAESEFAGVFRTDAVFSR